MTSWSELLRAQSSGPLFLLETCQSLTFAEQELGVSDEWPLYPNATVRKRGHNMDYRFRHSINNIPPHYANQNSVHVDLLCSHQVCTLT